MTNFEQVCIWHDRFAAYRQLLPDVPSKEVWSLRLALIEEEAKEVKQAMKSKDLVDIAKELADLLFVTYGAAAAYGIPMDDVFELVYKSNMSKLGPDGEVVRDAKGKIQKGPHYVKAEPEIAALLQRATL